jgi:hypothetical protein
VQQQLLLLGVGQHAELWSARQEALNAAKAGCSILQEMWLQVLLLLLLLGPAMHEGVTHEIMLVHCGGL